MAGGGWRFALTVGFLQTAKCIRWGAAALRTRAWIETSKTRVDRHAINGRPPYEGVDRNDRERLPFDAREVALRARAWIETLGSRNEHRHVHVALRARAWIETTRPCPRTPCSACRPPCEGVDRNPVITIGIDCQKGRPPCEGVDRNLGARLMAWKPRKSPSVRGRGSKLSGRRRAPRTRGVALRARAWIETSGGSTRPSKIIVALRARAWIETRPSGGSERGLTGRPPCDGVDRNSFADQGPVWDVGRPPCEGVDRNGVELDAVTIEYWSPSVRGRGSKPAGSAQTKKARPSPSVRGRGSKRRGGARWADAGAVALRARAWIETRIPDRPVRGDGRSPSVRGRGSKPMRIGPVPGARGGEPSVRGRGSKPLDVGRAASAHGVALRARAWIETCVSTRPTWAASSRPPCEGVDRNCSAAPPAGVPRCRPPCEGVDRNCSAAPPAGVPRCRPPCEGVDRNSLLPSSLAPGSSSPSARGRGSKLEVEPLIQIAGWSPSARGRGSKRAPRNGLFGRRHGGRPPHEGVDRNQLEIRSANTPTIVTARACARIETHLAANANSWTTSRPPPIRAPTSAAARPSVPAPWCRHSCGRRGRSWTSPS